MSFGAIVFNVMVASPGDVPNERIAFREVIHEWNAVHAEERKQVLLPIGWETHSAPDMSGHPQTVINKQLLINCDLLVGIFWTRIGTATAEYASGAVEEIERHIAAGKPVMLYFSEAPIKPDLVTNKQYKELQRFKSSCRSRGLYDGFSNVEEFKNKFRRQLHVIVNQYFEKGDSYVYDEEEVVVETVKQLSKDEAKLLKIASLDRTGTIHRMRIAAGTFIQTNRLHIISEQTAREIARWDAVLKTLCDKDYIEAVGFKGEVFRVTALGFEVADILELVE